MNEAEFLNKITDILQSDSDITLQTKLEDLEEWDSLSKMGVLAFLNNDCGQNLTFNNLANYNTIGDLAKIAGL